MVLEHLVPISKLEKKPWLGVILSFIFVSYAVLFALYFYPQGGGFFIVSLVTIPTVVVFLRILVREEKMIENGRRFISAHWRLIQLYGIFFIGMTLSFAFWASVLPKEASLMLFEEQKESYQSIRTVTSGIFMKERFDTIFQHNIIIMFLMLLASFLYSIGAVFLLIWNASVFGVFMENSIRSCMLSLSHYGFFAYPFAYLYGVFEGILFVIPHGVFEILAFLVASIAGGIMSLAVEHRCMGRKCNYLGIVVDVLVLVILAVVLLALGAAIEATY
ncbi:MAG: stage II sporulation protein M [Candidatus Micrarchaeia archaeon]